MKIYTEYNYPKGGYELPDESQYALLTPAQLRELIGGVPLSEIMHSRTPDGRIVIERAYLAELIEEYNLEGTLPAE
jgi:hypothetical protein